MARARPAPVDPGRRAPVAGGGDPLATAEIRIHRARARLKPALLGDCHYYRDQDRTFRWERKGPADEDQD